VVAEEEGTVSYKVKLEKVVPFVRPMPNMPDPVQLALAWINGHAQQGWINPALQVQFTAQGPMETVAFTPTITIRGEHYVQLTWQEPPAGKTQTAWQYKLEKVTPFVKPMPQMPDPAVLAIGWLNGHGKDGWFHPDVRLEFAQAGAVEQVAIQPTINIRNEPHILLRRQVELPVAAK
jgi:hypothetical protein